MVRKNKKHIISLTDMQINQEGIISCFEGGKNFQERFNVRNIRCGKKIKKISSNPFQGPIVVEIDNARMAIGFGMAKKVMVEIIEQ